MSTTTTAPEINSLKSRQKETWMALDYDRFSRYMEQGARIFYEQLNVPAGCQLLDVACGSGQVALWAALDGVNVTGVGAREAGPRSFRPYNDAPPLYFHLPFPAG
jgi:2-polyprenyl-3-methyl-5-hydroxy-6-metoxy-1,4-benzoquinol methylase